MFHLTYSPVEDDGTASTAVVLLNGQPFAVVTAVDDDYTVERNGISSEPMPRSEALALLDLTAAAFMSHISDQWDGPFADLHFGYAGF